MPSHTPHSSKTASPPHSPAQSKIFPSQSHVLSAMPSPSHTPHSSTTASPPHSPAQSKIFPSQSHVSSVIPSPSHTPHSSTTASPPHIPKQSISTKQFKSQSKFSNAYSQVPLSAVASTS